VKERGPACPRLAQAGALARLGKRFGRPNALDDGQKRVIADRHGKGATIPELAEEYGVGIGTIWRALNPFEVGASA
jgi:hypothetical protein